ncbi:glycosyltransferase [Pseudomonadota bacterium]
MPPGANNMQGEILLALDSRAIGGIETHVLTLAKGLREYGQEVSIVLLNHYGDHPLLGLANTAGVKVVELDGRPGSLYRYMKTHPPVLLHTHGYKAGIIGRISARLLSIAVVSTFHAGEPGQGVVGVYDFLDRYTACLAKSLAVSKAIAARIPYAVTVMDNFVSMPKDSFHEPTLSIAFVGRLSHEKGPDTFLKLAERFPNLCFEIFGDGDMRHELLANAPANIVFHGEVKEMASRWRHIGMLCISSRHEGLPMAALEAMANKVPVAAFDVGALPSLITDGINGYLAKQGDINALAEKVQIWITASNEQRMHLGREARQRIEDAYSCQCGIPRILAVYQHSCGLNT